MAYWPILEAENVKSWEQEPEITIKQTNNSRLCNLRHGFRISAYVRKSVGDEGGESVQDFSLDGEFTGDLS
jgi:hypothetical protein